MPSDNEETEHEVENYRVLNELLKLSLDDDPLPDLLKRALMIVFSLSWLRLLKKGAVFLSEEKSKTLVLVASHELAPQLHSLCARVAYGHCLCGRAAQTKELQFATCVDHRHEIRFGGMTPHGHYNVPIMGNDNSLLGVFTLYLTHGHKKCERETKFLSAFADILASLIKRKQAEAKAREHQQQSVHAKLALDEFALVTIVGTSGTITYVNDKFCEVSQYDRDELLGANHRILNSGYHSRAFYSQMYETISNGEIWNGEFKSKKKNGAYFWSDTVIVPFKDDSGEIEHYTIIQTDITARKNSNIELNRLAKIAQDSSQEIYIFHGETLKFIDANNSAIGNIGYSATELKRLTPIDISPEFSKEKWDSICEPLLSGTQRQVQFKTVHQRKNGTRYNVCVQLRRQHLEDDISFVAIVDDLDERNKQFNMMKSAIEGFRGGVSIFDKDLILTMANSEYYRIQSLNKKDQPIGSRFEDILRFIAKRGDYGPGDVEKLVKERLDTALKFEEYKFEYITPSKRTLEIHRSPILGGGFITTYVDISRRKSAENKLNDYRNNLERKVISRTSELVAQTADLQKALSKEKELTALQREFVSMASHEFRTPLAIIDSSVQRLQRKAKKDSLKSDDVLTRTGTIRSAIGRMTNLIESSLSFSKIENGEVSIKTRPVDIRALLGNIADRQKLIATNHEIFTDLDELPDTIFADPDMLDQVVTNLLSNAIKYAPDSPEIEIIGHTEGDTISVAVRDHGLGIDEDDLKNIGNRFFRAKTSVGIAGTGIGLNLSKKIAQMHGGTIKAESTKGLGSTFTLYLPISTGKNCVTTAPDTAKTA